MTRRLDVLKTYKLFIAGQFPRSESGRTIAVAAPAGAVAHVCRASRKDLRDAVAAARRALPAWSGEAPGGATPYLRGQILYRMAEMLDARAGEFAEAIAATSPRPATLSRARANHARPVALRGDAPAEVSAAVDRLVCFAGWADKFAQVLGCNNPVAGPYYNFTIPEPTGVVGVIAPDEPPLLALVSLVAPVLCAGNTCVALASESNPVVAAVFAEVCATSDLPPGVVNILTGLREELVPVFASHRDIDALHAAGVSPEHARLLRAGTAENLKRVVVHPDGTGTPPPRARAATDWFDDRAAASPSWIEPFVEFKTVWHPMGA